MNAPKQPTRSQQDSYPSDPALASTDFDRWAQAVRQQMLDCLQKRSK